MQPLNNKVAAIIVAAGKSSRCQTGGDGAEPAALRKKPFLKVTGKRAWLWSLEKFAERDDVAQIILAVAPEDRALIEEYFAKEIQKYGVRVVSGGAERFLTVENALAAVAPDCGFVAVHDAARPCVDRKVIGEVFDVAREYGAAIPASPVAGSLKRSQGADGARTVRESVSRDSLWEAQTPQVFARDVIERAYRDRAPDAAPTDDCGLVETLGIEVRIVASPRTNIKITSPEDLLIAEALLVAEARAVTQARLETP